MRIGQSIHALLGFDHVRHLVCEMARVGVEGEVEPELEPPLGRGLAVGVDVGRLDPGILDPGDAALEVVVGRTFESAEPNGLVPRRTDGVDEIDRAPLAQRAERRPVAPAGDLTQHRFGCLGRDVGEFKGPRIAPYGVIVPSAQHDRPVGNRLVEPAGVEESALDEAAVIRCAGDPLDVRVRCGETTHLGDDLVDAGTRAHLRSLRFEPAEDRVGVTIAEGGHEEAAVEVDSLDVCTGGEGRLGERIRDQGRTHRGDDAVDDEQCVARLAGGPEPDGAIVEM